MAVRQRILTFTATAVAAAFLWSPGTFGAQRTFVSAAAGNDANPCSRTLPCRNFSTALLFTDPGGEVVALDSGGYGPVDIHQSAALVAPDGIHAAITSFGTQAVLFFGAPTDVVVLRGLFLTGLGGQKGIEIRAGGRAYIERCVVSGFIAEGVYAQAVGAEIHAENVISRNNGHGFYFTSSAPTMNVTLVGVHAEGNLGQGIVARDNARVMVTRSVATANLSGFYAVQNGTIAVEASTSAFNVIGVGASGNGTAVAANTMITMNEFGVSATEFGTTVSLGNNRVHGNSTDGSFMTTSAEQ